MKKRSRAHEAGSIEAGSIEAGSSISKWIFFANRVDGAVVGEPNRASWGAQQRTEQPNRASEGARGSQMEPFEARSTPQGCQGQPRPSHSRPDRPSKGARGTDRARRGLPGRARSLGWSPSCPRNCQGRQGRQASSSNFVID